MKLGEYRLNDAGLIIDPGKFQGEPEYAPYFYKQADDGEICFDGARLLYLEDYDRRQFPDIIEKSTVAMLITESDDGFVRVVELDLEELDALKEEVEREDYREDD